jgi:hypothetical protein
VYFTVVVADSVNGPLYAGLAAVGVEPSSVYRITETPLWASVADRATSTDALYHPLGEQVPPLHLIDEVGAIVSIWMSCEFVASTLPELSHALYFTVVVAETVNEAV